MFPFLPKSSKSVLYQGLGRCHGNIRTSFVDTAIREVQMSHFSLFLADTENRPVASLEQDCIAQSCTVHETNGPSEVQIW